MLLYSLFIFSYHSLYMILRSIILFICLNKFFISLVAMNAFCKSYVDTDLASLHYIIFIKSYAVSPKEALSFDSEQFTNISINKLIEAKLKDPFLIFEEYFIANIFVYRKSYSIQFKDSLNEDLEFFTDHRVISIVCT